MSAMKTDIYELENIAGELSALSSLVGNMYRLSDMNEDGLSNVSYFLECEIDRRAQKIEDIFTKELQWCKEEK